MQSRNQTVYYLVDRKAKNVLMIGYVDPTGVSFRLAYHFLRNPINDWNAAFADSVLFYAPEGHRVVPWSDIFGRWKTDWKGWILLYSKHTFKPSRTWEAWPVTDVRLLSLIGDNDG